MMYTNIKVIWIMLPLFQLGCHRSIHNNQSAQTGNTLQYCKHKTINVELHLYCILSLVSYTDRHWGILKKLKRLEVLQCNISSCTFSYYNLHVFLWAHAVSLKLYITRCLNVLLNSVVWNCFVLQYII
jgi:hypothetical protein